MPNLRHRLVSSVTRRFPFLSGCGTFANSSIVRRIAGTSEGLAWARLDSGSEILVPLDDYVGRAAYFVGDLDRKLSVVIKRIVRPGDSALDIGANLGVVTLPLAQLVAKRGVVHSFEPNPVVRDLLLRSLRRNGLSNVRVHDCALGAEEGAINLSYPRGNAGMGTLSEMKSGDGWCSVQVRVRTLSSIAEELSLDKIRLVKIDVEGHELAVLRGAGQWLTSHPPDAILFECNDISYKSGAVGVFALLESHGYSLYSIPRNLLSVNLMPYRADARSQQTSHDMITIKLECEQEIASRLRVLN